MLVPYNVIVHQVAINDVPILSGDSHSRLLLGKIALFIDTQYFFHLPSLGQLVDQLV